MGSVGAGAEVGVLPLPCSRGRNELNQGLRRTVVYERPFVVAGRRGPRTASLTGSTGHLPGTAKPRPQPP
jgi:hypothetical protein